MAYANEIWKKCIILMSVVQSLSHVQLFVEDMASLSFAISQFTQTHIHCVGDAIQPSHPLLPPLRPSVFSRIKVFSNELPLRIQLPKYWSFSLSSSNDYSGLISFRIDSFRRLSRVIFSTTIWKHQFLDSQSSLWSNSHIHTWLLETP